MKAQESGDKVLLIVYSYHHGNTWKVAESIAEGLGADIRTPDHVSPDALAEYDLVGFGSGIDSGHHYRPLLDLADRIPSVEDRSAFLFSTCGIPGRFARGERFERFVEGNHSALRTKLQARGYRVVGEWSCVGFNTNSFLRFFGGLNKGRPNADDLVRAKEFAVAALNQR